MKTELLRSRKLVVAVVVAGMLMGGLRGLTAMAGEGDPPAAEQEKAVPPDGTASIVANSTDAEDVPVLNTAPPPMAIQVSPSAAEVARLAEAGLGESVMLAFVANATNLFNLNSDQIIFLNDLGLPAPVIAAMIQRDLALKAGRPGGWNQFTTNAPVPPTPLFVGGPGSPPPMLSGVPEPNVYAPDFSDYDAGYYAGQGDYDFTQDDSLTFYDSLAPYGAWINVAGYGRCWQPTVCVVNHEWRPFGDRGRWINTDCGWYWQSDYSWGWAAFHYGRWFSDARFGWLWRPDREWGPAWVSWRHSAEYCGWAPLPPGARFVRGVGFQFNHQAVGVNVEFGIAARLYTFVRTEHFADYSPYRYRVSPWDAKRVHAETVVNNTISFVRGHPVYPGIDARLVAAASHTEIRKAEVRESPLIHEHGVKVDRLEHSGAKLVVERPKLPEPKASSQSIPVPAKPGVSVAAPSKSPVESASSVVDATGTNGDSSASSKLPPGASPSWGMSIIARRDPAVVATPPALQPALTAPTPGKALAPLQANATALGTTMARPANNAPASNPATSNKVPPGPPPNQFTAQTQLREWRPLPNMNLANRPASAGAGSQPNAPGNQSAAAAPVFNHSGGFSGWQQFERARVQDTDARGIAIGQDPGAGQLPSALPSRLAPGGAYFGVPQAGAARSPESAGGFNPNPYGQGVPANSSANHSPPAARSSESSSAPAPHSSAPPPQSSTPTPSHPSPPPPSSPPASSGNNQSSSTHK